MSQPLDRPLSPLPRIWPGIERRAESEVSRWLADIRRQLHEQDDAFTAHAIHLVQEQEQIFGIETESAEKTAWYEVGDDYEVVKDSELDKKLDALFDETLEDQIEFDGATYRLIGSVTRWRYVQPFLTRQAAMAYCETQSHRHKGELRVFVDSAHRNPEWRMLRQLLMGELYELDVERRTLRAWVGRWDAWGSAIARAVGLPSDWPSDDGPERFRAWAGAILRHVSAGWGPRAIERPSALAAADRIEELFEGLPSFAVAHDAVRDAVGALRASHAMYEHLLSLVEEAWKADGGSNEERIAFDRLCDYCDDHHDRLAKIAEGQA